MCYDLTLTAKKMSINEGATKQRRHIDVMYSAIETRQHRNAVQCRKSRSQHSAAVAYLMQGVQIARRT